MSEVEWSEGKTNDQSESKEHKIIYTLNIFKRMALIIIFFLCIYIYIFLLTEKDKQLKHSSYKVYGGII